MWDSEALKKDLDSRVKPNTTFNISTSDSISEKSKLLEMSSSLKASVLGGLVEVCGSAQYLKDQTTSLLQSRIALQYGQTVRFEQLTMTHLGQVKYPQVFEQKSATHVVVAVLFGAQAFFVFDKQTQSAESKRKMDAKLQGVLRKMPQLSLDWEGAVAKFSSNDRDELKTFSCTFYGDYQLKKMPTNFEEAVQVYNALPTMLGEKGEMAVPIRVWLLPLATLEPRAARLEHMISSMSISEVESAMESLGAMLNQCADLLQDPLLSRLGRVQEQLTQVQELVRHYRSSFRRKVAELLWAVRGGEQKEVALEEALDAHQASPFSAQQLQRWLNQKRAEAKVLELYVRSLSSMTTVCSAQQLEEFRLDPQKETVISFSFTSVDRDEPYLRQVKSYLEHPQVPKSQGAAAVVDGPEEKPWFCCNIISKKMREQLRVFMELMKANRGEGVRFITCSLADAELPGADIHLFHRGLRVLPLTLDEPQPATVEDLQRSSVTLRLPEPPVGVVRYRLELAERSDEQPGAGEHNKWTITETQDTPKTWTYSDLNQRRVYLFRYRAVTDILVGLASKVTQFQTKGFFY